MKTIQLELNEKLAAELNALVQQGFFKTEEELIRFALIDFIESHKPALVEKFQHEDIEWAIKQKKAS